MNLCEGHAIPNPNYLAGRRFEYERKKYYENLGWEVLRTAGSHGRWDLVGIDWKRDKVTLIQCKLVQSKSTATHILKWFRVKSPEMPSGIHQRMDVRIRGSSTVESVTI